MTAAKGGLGVGGRHTALAVGGVSPSPHPLPLGEGFSWLAGILDGGAGRRYRGGVIPPFNERGLLPPGVHWAEGWAELQERCGGTPWRRLLLTGLGFALRDLRNAGCRTAYIDGSFVTSKDNPGDFDVCWEEAGVNTARLTRALRDLSEGRRAQKARYAGELFPAHNIADIARGITYYEFFQRELNGVVKGMVAIDLRTLP